MTIRLYIKQDMVAVNKWCAPVLSVLWGSVCLGAIQIGRNLDEEWTDVDIDIDERVYRYEFGILTFLPPQV